MCRWYCLSEGPSTNLVCYQCGCRYCAACLHSEAGKFPSLIKCAACGKCPRTQPKGRKNWHTPVLVMGTGSARAPIPILGEGRAREKPRWEGGYDGPSTVAPRAAGDPTPHKRVFAVNASIAERTRNGERSKLLQRTTAMDRSQSWVSDNPAAPAFTGTRFTERPLCEEEKEVQEQVLLERTGRVFYWERLEETAKRAPSVVGTISLADELGQLGDGLPPPPSYSVSLVDGDDGEDSMPPPAPRQRASPRQPQQGGDDDFTVSFRRAAARQQQQQQRQAPSPGPEYAPQGGYRQRAAAGRSHAEQQQQQQQQYINNNDDPVSPTTRRNREELEEEALYERAARAREMQQHQPPPQQPRQQRQPQPQPQPQPQYDDQIQSDDSEGEDDYGDYGGEDPMDALERIFVTFCEFGRGQHSASTMDISRFAKLTRDTGLLDKRLTHIDVDLIFTKSKAINGRRIPFEVFARVALPQIAAKKFPKMPLHDALDRVVGIILASQGPLAYGTAIANKEGGLFERLCSPDTYSGMYRRRFDEFKPKYLSIPAYQGDTNTGTDEVIHDISQILNRDRGYSAEAGKRTFR